MTETMGESRYSGSTPHPPTASSLHARTRIPGVRRCFKHDAIMADHQERAEVPDDGEPNPVTAGFVLDGAADCGRPKPCTKGDCAKCRALASTPTESILGEAHRLVHGERGADYGHPLDNHGATASMFEAYLYRKYGWEIALDADDVCWFNILQKASRDAHEPTRDNLVDTAGYAHNLELIRAERARRSDTT